jgi:hypothetical protein
MPGPEISVVVPLYNKEREIGRCIRSVLGQSFQNFELIVVNDGSTDGSADLVRASGDRRIRLIEKANGGLASARNRGIDEASAELIAFLDADDQWCPEFLATILSSAKLHPEAGAYFTGFWIHRGNGWARKVTIPRKYLLQDKPLLKDYFATPRGSTIPSAFAAWKKTFEKTGTFRQMFGEDVDMWFRIAAFYPIGYSGATQAIWHLDASNRICVEQGSRNQKHTPGSLAQSLKAIGSAPGIPAAIKHKALAYAAQRELRALLPARCREGDEPALRLLMLWEQTYGKAPLSIRCAMRIPRSLLQGIESVRAYGKKSLLAWDYLRTRQQARQVISALTEERTPPSVLDE